jgi:Zn-dependent alcohol dehydrogenase
LAKASKDDAVIVFDNAGLVVNWSPDCGHCPECLRGEPYLCMTFIGEAFIFSPIFLMIPPA